MAKYKQGRQFTDEEVENLESGMWDDEMVLVVCEAEGWVKIGPVSVHRNDFDVDFYDPEQVFYDVEIYHE